MRRTVLFLGTLVLILSTTAFGWTRTDTLKVTATGNDGVVTGTTFSSTANTIEWGRSDVPSVRQGWWRVMSKIPAGRSITSVVPIPRAVSISGVDTSYWRLSKQDDPAAPTSTAEYNAIAKTNDSVRTIGGTWTSGTRYRLEDLTVTFKETYDLGYCDSGKFLIVFAIGRNLASAHLFRRTYDIGFSSGYDFWLEIVHTDAPSTAVKSHRRRVLQIGSLEPQYHEWAQWERIQ